MIEQAAARLFAQRGFDAVSIEEIAAAAQITKPTLYDHFPDKLALYRHLLALESRQMVEYMRSRVETARGTPHQKLEETLDAFFAFVEEHQFAWRMLFREPPADPRIARGARSIHRAASENVARLLRRMEPSRRRLPERELQLRAEALKSAQQGLAAWWYEHPEAARGELVDALVRIDWLGGRGGG